jgi:hypothetical protein
MWFGTDADETPSRALPANLCLLAAVARMRTCYAALGQRRRSRRPDAGGPGAAASGRTCTARHAAERLGNRRLIRARGQQSAICGQRLGCLQRVEPSRQIGTHHVLRHGRSQRVELIIGEPTCVATVKVLIYKCELRQAVEREEGRM